MKRTVWQNRNLDLAEWMEWLRENEEINGINPDSRDEDYYYQGMYEANNMFLDDERMNLDVDLGRTIIVIADIGRWNGRRSGYKLIESGNIADCLSSECEYAEWYVDEKGEFRFSGSHHDGDNYHYYRVLKPEVTDDQLERLTDAIYYGNFDKARNYIKKFTERLGDYVGDVYGWKFANRPKASATFAM